MAAGRRKGIRPPKTDLEGVALCESCTYQGCGLQPQYSVSRLPCPAFACAQLGQGYVQNCVLRVGFQPLFALCFVREKDFHKVWAGTLQNSIAE